MDKYLTEVFSLRYNYNKRKNTLLKLPVDKYLTESLGYRYNTDMINYNKIKYNGVIMTLKEYQTLVTRGL